jgi:hypothetical protein
MHKVFEYLSQHEKEAFGYPQRKKGSGEPYTLFFLIILFICVYETPATRASLCCENPS